MLSFAGIGLLVNLAHLEVDTLALEGVIVRVDLGVEQRHSSRLAALLGVLDVDHGNLAINQL
ncbi:hypothetical protein D3C81_2272550 [compost metagenome]